MGKVSPVAAKYIVVAEIEIEGSVDRPDVIGAIFGQTEGLLGTELELRELQRSGKIGRIEVDLTTKAGKCSGTISIPSNLDQAETAIIAAALETIERIGPCNSKVKVLKLEDVRITKRNFVVGRAKELLDKFQHQVMPDSQEITTEVSQSVRTKEITEWGKDKLPAGPGAQDAEEIILVEGRADVITLLKNGIKNTVALNGTSVPSSVVDLCKQKTVIVFVDGDRGGNLIIRELLQAGGEVDFVAKAPDGKEVEELTKKEVHLALRAKQTIAQYKLDAKNPKTRRTSTRQSKTNTRRTSDRSRRSSERTPRPRQVRMKAADKEKFSKMLDDMVGTRAACLLDAQGNVLGKVPSAELEATLSGVEGVHTVIVDGEVTAEMAKAASRAKAKLIIGQEASARPSARIRVVKKADL